MDVGGKCNWYSPPVLLNVGDTLYLEAGYFDGNNSPKYSNVLPHKAKTILKGSIISVYLKFVKVC